MAAVPMQYAGDEAALVVVNDITERKESEEKLREAEQHLSDALALAPDGVALYDENERLVICNKSYADITCVPLAHAAGISHDEVCDRAVGGRPRDRKSTRLTPVTNAHLVCRLLLEKK